MNDWGTLISTSFAPGGVTVASLVIAILILGSRGVWYYGTTVRDLTKDRDDWKAIATASAATVREQADQIARLTNVVEKMAAQQGGAKR